MEANKIQVIDDQGNEKEFEVLFTFNNDELGKQYVLYYDSLAEEPNVFASIYDDEDYLISRKMLGNDEAYGDDSYYDDEDYLDMADAVSSNDCTGLLTHGTGLEEELDYYSQLYKFGTSPDE